MLATNFNKDINHFPEALLWTFSYGKNKQKKTKNKKPTQKDLDGVFKIAILIC